MYAADYALMKMYLLGPVNDFSVQDDLAAGVLNLEGVIDVLDFIMLPCISPFGISAV